MTLKEMRRVSMGGGKQTSPVLDYRLRSIGRHLHCCLSADKASGMEWHRCWWMLFGSMEHTNWRIGLILETFELMPVAGSLFR